MHQIRNPGIEDPPVQRQNLAKSYNLRSLARLPLRQGAISNLSLRGRLTLLIAGAVVPVAILAGTTAYILFEANETAASAQLLRLSRSLLNTVEARVQAITSAAQVLSVSHDLRDGNLKAFLEDAQTFLRAFNPDSSVVLTDRSGAQVLNTAAGEPLERRSLAVEATRDARQQVFETGKPVVSRHFFAPLLQRHMITVNVPVMKGDAPVYNLGIPITVDALSDILQQQDLKPDWTVAIWDSGGTVIARNREIARFAGHKASPTIYPAIAQKKDQVLTTVTFDGVRVRTALAHSPTLDWSLAVGAPETSIMMPLWSALFAILAFSAGCLLLSGIAAARLGRRVLEADRQKEIMINELNHRVKNSMATLQSIAYQTLRRSKSKDDALVSLDARIMALSRAHNVLTAQHWEAAKIGDIVAHALEPFATAEGIIEVENGPDVRINPRSALAISLAIHELATNAAKYGALSAPHGRVKLEWRLENKSRLVLVWRESGGPPVSQPARRGFGTSLIERGLAQDLGGSANLEYRPEGVVCTLSCRTHSRILPAL